MVDRVLLPDARLVRTTSAPPAPARERRGPLGAPDDRHELAFDTSFGHALGLELARERVRLRVQPRVNSLVTVADRLGHRVAGEGTVPRARRTYWWPDNIRALARPRGRPSAGTLRRSASPAPRSRSRMNRVHERRARMTHLNRTRRGGPTPPRADVRARPHGVTPRFRTGPRIGGAHTRPRACLDGMRRRAGRIAVTPFAFLAGMSRAEVTMAPMRYGGVAPQDLGLVVEMLSR